ncbi:MAG: hypothetical protein COC05_07275 [Gammaproteobacteria bacterium]|nr:MAG: hypothetical protein COC05_07275 [Gammaproteobacteria bacterium]
MLYYFAHDPDMEYIMVDSTILRAHACSAGALKKTEGKMSTLQGVLVVDFRPGFTDFAMP